MKLYAFILIQTVVCFNAYSQPTIAIDSAVIKKSDSLARVIARLINSDVDSAYKVIQFAQAYSQDNNHERGMAQVMNSYATYFSMRGESAKSIDYYKKTSDISKRIGNDTFVAIANYNIGAILYDDGQYNEAIRYFEQSYEFFKKINNRTQMVGSNSAIANTYIKIGGNLD